MSLFDPLSISGTGMSTYQTWLDALGGNIANMNDTASTKSPVFQPQYVVAAPAGPVAGGNGVGQGVRVAGIALGPSTGELVYQPSNPLANAKGYVRQPLMSLGSQMVSLVMAQNGFQASVSAFNQARTAYLAALSIGNGA